MRSLPERRLVALHCAVTEEPKQSQACAPRARTCSIWTSSGTALRTIGGAARSRASNQTRRVACARTARCRREGSIGDSGGVRAVCFSVMAESLRHANATAVTLKTRTRRNDCSTVRTQMFRMAAKETVASKGATPVGYGTAAQPAQKAFHSRSAARRWAGSGALCFHLVPRAVLRPKLLQLERRRLRVVVDFAVIE